MSASLVAQGSENVSVNNPGGSRAMSGLMSVYLVVYDSEGVKVRILGDLGQCRSKC